MPGSTLQRAVLPHPLELTLRFAVTGGAVLWLAHVYAQQLVEALLPTLRATLAFLGDEFRILDLRLAASGPNEVLQLTVDFARILFVNGEYIRPLAMRGGGWMQTGINLGAILQHPAMLLIVVLAWPGRLAALALRLLLAAPLIALLLFVNVPLTLLAELWFPIHDEVAPEQFWPLLAWSRFLMNGGGLVLALAMGAVAIAGAAVLARRLRFPVLRPHAAATVGAVLLAVLCGLYSPELQAEPVSAASRARIAAGNPTWVIVEFRADAVEQAARTERTRRGLRNDDTALLSLRRNGYRAIKDAVEAAVRDADVTEVRDYRQLPMAAWRVRSTRALQRLEALPQVAAVYENSMLRPVSVSSLGFIDQPVTAAAGATGVGTTIAVIDGGLNLTYNLNPDFGPCLGVGNPAGTCRVVVYETAPGAGSTSTVHGTSVAAIALGTAPGARLAHFDVFTGDAAYLNDVLWGIGRAIELQSTWNVVAINMSLGDGGTYGTQCGLPENPFYTPIGLARSAGIQTVVAAGNNGMKSGLANPACVPDAVSVGAVYDNDYGWRGWSLPPPVGGSCSDATTAADQVTCFSQSASYLSLLAPGAIISAPDSGSQLGGTSQAAPHVTGAWAVLRAYYPLETLAQTLQRMQLSGVDVGTQSGDNPWNTKRLNLYDALQLGTALVLTGTGPSQAVSGTTASYTLTVANNGPLQATSLSVEFVMPYGATLQSSSGGCSLANGKVHCTASILNAGSQTSFTITVQWSFTGPVYTTARVVADQVNAAPPGQQDIGIGAEPTSEGDAPLPLWALVMLGAGLMRLSLRRGRSASAPA